MNSGLLPLWQNQSLCQTICMKTHVTCTSILLKFKSFSCEMFCTSIHSKRRPREKATPKWKLNLHMSQVAHQVGTYSGFCSISGSISTIRPPSPQWDASPLQGYMYLTLLNLPVLVSPAEWKEVVRVQCLAQEHNTMLPARAQGQTAQNRKVKKNQITGCLHRQLINFKMGNN